MNVTIEGAKIFFTIPVLGGIPITATMVNSTLVVLLVTGICIFLTRGMTVRGTGTRQVIAEFLVEIADGFVESNMGKSYAHFGPFIAALFCSSIFGSFLSLVGMYPPTADLSTELAWALLVFGMITFTKIKTGGIGGYLLGFTQPIPVLTPFNVLSELATPISMSFRHFGNVLSGSVITALLYAALAAGTHALLSWIPGAAGQLLSNIPFLQVGIPAVFSVYFDLFSGAMQAFIFCMLTMLYIANAAQD